MAPSKRELGVRSTALLLSAWNEVAGGSGVEHDAARDRLAIASDLAFAHQDRTGSLRLDPGAQIGRRTGAVVPAPWAGGCQGCAPVKAGPALSGYGPALAHELGQAASRTPWPCERHPCSPGLGAGAQADMRCAV
jgi:hypothetical protein